MRLSRGDRLGPYEVLDALGAGGMGVVYRARDPRLDRHVALKVLSDDLSADPDARARMRREATAAAALDHPFICKIFEIGEHPNGEAGTLFLVLEYIAGQTLRERLTAGRMPAAEALRLASEIAEALQVAHDRGFLHRDLKPENIMLTEHGHVKVMDFGLARRIAVEDDARDQPTQFVTKVGVIAGTLEYMSPEQHKGLDLDARSDLFAFGAILAEMVSGRHPFHRSTTAETLAAIMTGQPDFGRQIELDAVAQRLLVMSRRLLAKAPEDRYSSVSPMRDDLLRVANPSEFAAASTWRDQTPDTGQTPTIGREAELERLIQLMDDAIAGRGSAVLIAGEPGIGKSHLASALLEAARRRGLLAVTGHCYEMEGSPPFGPFVEQLESCAKQLPRDTFRHALGEEAPEVARLMPELRLKFSDIPQPLDVPPEQQRRYLFNAFREFAARTARLAPIVALAEDLHWADGPTLLLLQHLAQAVPGLPILLVGTYRPADLSPDSPLASALEFLSRQKLAVTVTLRPWSVGEVDRMLAALSGQPPPPALASVVFDETEGNPFFVAEVFRHLSEEGVLFDAAGKFRADLRVDRLKVPDSVRLVIRRRLGRLSEGARRVLTMAAVVGRAFPLELIEELERASVETARDVTLDALEEAEHAHLIDGAGDRHTGYRFVHELVRLTLIETLSAPRRQRVHLRIADAIERIFAASLDAQAPALAYHLWSAGSDAPPDRTIHYLSVAAARASAAAAHEEALDHLDKALALVETRVSPIGGGLLVQRAIALQSLGRVTEAIAAYEETLAVSDALGDLGRYVETCVPLLHLYAFAMRPADMQSLVERAVVKAQGAPPGVRGVILAMRAAALSFGGMLDAALASLDELRAIPPQELPPSAIGFVMMLEVHVRDEAGQMDLAEAVARQATEMLERAGSLWFREAIAYGVYEPPLYRGNPVEAERLARESISRAGRLDFDAVKLAAMRSLADLQLARGDLAEAERTARDALALLVAGGSSMMFSVETSLAGILHLGDRSEEAMPLLLSAAGRRMPFFAGYPESLFALCQVVLGSPDADAAIDAAVKWLPGPGRSRGLGGWHAVTLLVEALRRRNRCSEAARMVDAAEKVAAEWDSNHYAFPVRSAAGIAAACAGDWTRAEEHHRAAIERMDAVPYATARAIARYWYADMLIERGGTDDRSPAAELLETAATLSDAIGLALYARLARQRLAEMTR